MAPLRRYLRITKHSVLEVRIYLDRPADAEAWLLRRSDPALPRVIQAVRPLVLPKLREENERGRGGKGGSKARKKGVKDVVVEDDFEVSIFLTDLSSRHSVLTKQKIIKDKPRIKSNAGKLTSWLTTGTSEQPMVVSEDNTEPIVIRDEDENEVNLADIPEGCIEQAGSTASNQNRRTRGHPTEEVVSDTDDSASFESPAPKRNRRGSRDFPTEYEDELQQDDKKKLGVDTSWDGFSIYGRILCLVVKRKGARNVTSGSKAPASSQQMMESWVSTQAAAEPVDDDEDNG